MVRGRRWFSLAEGGQRAFRSTAVDPLGGLCIFCFVMAIVTLVGHAIWVGVAAVFRFLTGENSQPPPLGRPCPVCYQPRSVIRGRCIVCGHVPEVSPVVSLEQDLEGTARHL